MTVKWEKFAGRTDVFAVRISFMPDPDRNIAVSPDESESWGALQMWVHGRNLCAHVDQGELLQNVHWYLLPFLEWVVDSWNPLLHEERLPNRNARDSAASSLAVSRNAPELVGETATVAWEQEWFEWRERHAVRTARAGGLFPNIVLRRLRDDIEVSWRDEPLAGAPEGFQFSVSEGYSLLKPEEIATPLYEAAAAAVEHLISLHPSSLRLSALDIAIKDLAIQNQRDIRLRWLAGLATAPPESRRLLGRTTQEDIKSTWDRVLRALGDQESDDAFHAALAADDRSLVVAGSCQAALLFGAVSPTVSETDVQTLAAVLVGQYRPSDAESETLKELTSQESIGVAATPWEQGYDLAEALHEELKLEGDWIDIEGLIKDLGIVRLERGLDDTAIRACSIVGPHHTPTIVVNRNSDYAANIAAVRFTLAHELCHILYDRARGRRLAIASGPWAPRGIERRANAFAAMFLMPPHLVKDAVADAPDPIGDPNGVRAVASRLHVSNRAAIEHLYNLTLMDDDQRDRLLRALGLAVY
jgi:Zn-dependent peptidase ImmA (M78 family)